jgi:hypothetical protein
MTEEQLSALLRVKRFEQPPPQYFERLLQDVHRRQRADLLQLPLWKIALERMQTFFGEHSMGRLSYAGAMASVLVVGVTTIGVMMPAVQRSEKQVAVTPPTPSGNEWVRLDATTKPQFALDTPPLQTAPAGYASVTSQPRYIMDTHPVSYEVSSF